MEPTALDDVADEALFRAFLDSLTLTWASGDHPIDGQAYHRRTMAMSTAPHARRRSWVRLGLLLIVALFIAHDAVYLAQFGIGGRLAAVMTERGHDGYWLAMIAVAVMAGVLAAAGAVNAVLRLRQRLRTVPATSSDRSMRPPYHREVWRLWRVLLPATLVLFGVQENIEYLAAHGDVIGIEALVGPYAPLAIPVLALVTLALAAIGALVRWRIAVLESRIARSLSTALPRSTWSPPPEWRTIDATAPHRWTLRRPDAGRAPPRILPA